MPDRWKSVAAAVMAVSLFAAAPTQAKGEKMAKDPKIAVVEKMINAWDTKNWKLVGELFTEDGVLHSMMIEPIVGRAAIAQRIDGMGEGIDSIKLNIRHIGVIDGVVFVERVDEFVYKGHPGKVPVVGVIEVQGDKIKEWREYYDRAELVAAMGLKEDFHKPSGR